MTNENAILYNTVPCVLNIFLYTHLHSYPNLCFGIISYIMVCWLCNNSEIENWEPFDNIE